ncbi:hypothetical protein M5K25_025221 [Dendrobium thyrsiflorum]|uniref:Aminotransferase-like plant mobile domain-containing protein n=1 Tax=Dendrobium thyrsiflorum TaxID=117978 RepID=A0ABD0U3V1_DENTH
MAGGGAKAEPEEAKAEPEEAKAEPEEELSSRCSGWDSENWERSEEGRTKSKNKVLPDGFLDPLPRQKSSKLQRFSNEMASRGAQGETHNQGVVIKDIPPLASTNLYVDAPQRTHRATHQDDATILEAASHLLMVREWPVECPRFIAALDITVMRWSPETNTFHLPVGEMTVTLEDVAMILGARIDVFPLVGHPAVGCGRRWLTWSECCDELLGEHPIDDFIYSNPNEPTMTAKFKMGQANAKTCIPLRWLKWCFSRSFYEDLKDHELSWHVIAYIFFLIGCFLMSDTSGCEVHLQWLPEIEEIQRFSHFSLGGPSLHIFIGNFVRPLVQVEKLFLVVFTYYRYFVSSLPLTNTAAIEQLVANEFLAWSRSCMASGDESPHRSITSMFSRKKKLSTIPIGSRRGGQGQEQTIPPVTGVSSPPPESQHQSPTEQGQGQIDPPVVGVPPNTGYFPTPTSTSPQFFSLDHRQSAPFYPYYPPPTSQTVPSTYPYPPYHHPYYYPPHVQPEQGGPSTQAKVRVGEPAAAEDKRVYIEPEGDTFNPARQTTHKIRDIIRSKYDAPYLSWKKIPKEVRDMWFREFQKDFRWLPAHGSRIRTNFEKRGSTRLRDMFTDIRKSGQRPLWIGERVWANLTKAWASPKFTKLREQNKQNRASDCGGLGSSLHTGGSMPHTEHRRRLKEYLGREPTPLELHARTHQHRVDHQWVDEKARKAHDDFIRLREGQPSTCERSSLGSTQYSEYHMWSEAVGGRQNGRVYGLGSQGYVIESSTSTSAFYDSSGVEETVSQRVATLTREIEKMRQIQAEMQAELRSYRVENQKKKEQEPVHESQGSEDTEDD